MAAKTAGGKSVTRSGTSNKGKSKESRGRGITKGSIRRLARRGGCKRLASSIYDEARGIVRSFIKGILTDAHALMGVNERHPVMTMRVEHILYALRKRGRTLYVS